VRIHVYVGAFVGYATESRLVAAVSNGDGEEVEEVEDFYPSVGKYTTRSFRVCRAEENGSGCMPMDEGCVLRIAPLIVLCPAHVPCIHALCCGLVLYVRV
jgi:hypothetical protein